MYLLKICNIVSMDPIKLLQQILSKDRKIANLTTFQQTNSRKRKENYISSKCVYIATLMHLQPEMALFGSNITVVRKLSGFWFCLDKRLVCNCLFSIKSSLYTLYTQVLG